MRWFKHFSDNHRGQSVQILLDELGYFGPFFYYTLYEICAEKLESKLDAELTQEDSRIRLHRRVVCSATRAKPSSVTRALVLGQSCGLWSFSFDGEFIEINIPILLNLLDRDMKKPRLKRGKSAPNPRLDKDKDKDKEEDKDKDKDSRRVAKPKATSKPEIEGAENSGSEMVAAYCDLWKARYGTRPALRPQDTKALKQVAKENGLQRAKSLLEVFFQVPDPYFVKRRHDLQTFCSNLSSIVAFQQGNGVVTNAKVRQMDVVASNEQTLQEVLKKIKVGAL